MQILLKLLRVPLFLLCGASLDFLFDSLRKKSDSYIDCLLTELFFSLQQTNKKFKAQFLASLETLNCILRAEKIEYDSFCKRITANFDNVLIQLSSTVELTKNPDFFNFISTFSKTFNKHFTPDNLANLLRALVKRILEDSAPPKKTLNVKKGTVTKGKGIGE